MFSSRFTSFVLVLYLLFFLLVWNSHAQTGLTYEMPRYGKTRVSETASTVRNKLESAEIHPAKEVRESYAGAAGGRKMKLGKAVVGGDSTDKGSESYVGEDSKSSPVNGSAVGSKDVVRAKLTLRRSRTWRSKSHGQSQLVGVKTERFVPFSADYYVPKPHPPKHN